MTLIFSTSWHSSSLASDSGPQCVPSLVLTGPWFWFSVHLDSDLHRGQLSLKSWQCSSLVPDYGPTYGLILALILSWLSSSIEPSLVLTRTYLSSSVSPHCGPHCALSLFLTGLECGPHNSLIWSSLRPESGPFNCLTLWFTKAWHVATLGLTISQ